MPRLFGLASVAILSWLLIDEASHQRMRRWIRAQRRDSPSARMQRAREAAAEMADELRAVAP